MQHGSQHQIDSPWVMNVLFITRNVVKFRMQIFYDTDFTFQEKKAAGEISQLGTDTKWSRFSLDHLQGAFLVLTLGTVLSAVAFVLEYAWNIYYW